MSVFLHIGASVYIVFVCLDQFKSLVAGCDEKFFSLI